MTISVQEAGRLGGLKKSNKKAKAAKANWLKALAAMRKRKNKRG
jgi:hypothetical protein